ncbi:MAG: permease prefix domain 1-containing protein [Planctomycetota bacterium]|nr:permease prefix domain 1-containing protein [Planctomycetota bacterium]
MPEHEFEIYLSVLSRLMKLDEKQKAAIADELSDHLEQRFEELVRSGLGRDEAIRQALDEFGDASGLAVDLTRVSQKRIRRIIMRSSLATAALLLAGFSWMFLFPPANTDLETNPRLIAQDNQQGTGEQAEPGEESQSVVQISIGRDSSDLDAPFLKKKIVVQFHELPLVDTLNVISESAEIPVLLDTVSLEDAGLLADLSVSFSSLPADSQTQVDALLDAETPQSEWDESLRMRIDQILDLMLAEHGLAWYVEDGILQVTTKEFAEAHFINRSYDLEPFRKAGFDSSTILQIIMNESAGLWEEIDGSGGKVVIVGDVMTIRQEFRVQRALSAMLQAMLDPRQPTYGVYHAEHMVCLHSLQKQTSVNFAELPLVDALQFLSVATGSRIYLDNSDRA